jgi:AcrR family transcriptional regulator
MPKLWNETIAEHRRDVRAAILDATWALATEKGLTSMTMSHIAQKTGIGRATLYKYFPDVEAILLAWHQRHIEQHLAELTQIRDRHGDPLERLRDVLMQYAIIAHRRGIHAMDLMTFLHRDQHVNVAERQVERVIRDLLAEAAAAGDIRRDVDPEELARYCLHALTAASSMPSKPAVKRLVAVTMSGLHNQAERIGSPESLPLGRGDDQGQRR